MKYDSLIVNFKPLVDQSKNILVALPSKVDVDKLAAGLAVYLSLKTSGKNVKIVTEDTLLVDHSRLIGVGDVANNLSFSGGDLTVTLEGVVAPDGTVPALEKLDWFPEGENLNLVFHVLPNQVFQPKNIVPKYASSGYDLIFVIGANTLDALGQIYQGNQQKFTDAKIINIQNGASNLPFGHFNVVDPDSPTVSEMVAQILASLGFTMDADTASNILAGIYDATGNLSTGVGADTLFAAGSALQSGGRIPQPPPAATPMEEQFAQSFTPQSSKPPITPSDTSKQEVPAGEAAVTTPTETASPAPDWLTPKVFRGGGLG